MAAASTDSHTRVVILDTTISLTVVSISVESDTEMINTAMAISPLMLPVVIT